MVATNRLQRAVWVLVLGVWLASYGAVSAQGGTGDSNAALKAGVNTINGTFKITYPAILEHLINDGYVALEDMAAFVKRDRDFASPHGSEQLAAIEGDLGTGAQFTLSLPIVPRATFSDVSNGKGDSHGVQIFVVIFDTNFYGDVFPGAYESGGWPDSNSSARYDPGTDEVTGGYLIIWSPDDRQMFPSDFGADGLLFTADDPVKPLQAGWTVVNLDKHPFDLLRENAVQLTLIEGDTGSVDLTKLSYTKAFDALIADLRVRYALSDFKKIDYDAVIKELRPIVERAQREKDAGLYKLALFELAESFHDGHVSSTLPPGIFSFYIGGVGLKLGETDDQQVIVRESNGAAAAAGIKRGAVITRWNGRPVQQAIAAVKLLSNYSNPRILHYDQVNFLPRTTSGTRLRVTFRNPGDTELTTVTLTAVQDVDGLLAVLPFSGESLQMPITAKILPSGFGYIEVTTFSINPQLLIETWEWALKEFAARDVPGLIIDLRNNGGGFASLPLYMGGSFYQKRFVLTVSYRADKSGNFITQGQREVIPAPVQWTKPVAVLISPYCASACELFAATIAYNPKNLIVGSYPTFGVAAGLYGPWLLPEGIEFSAPVIQPRTPDGKIFLENVGVEPNVKVPVTVESLLSKDDGLLPAAERALRLRAGQ